MSPPQPVLTTLPIAATTPAASAPIQPCPPRRSHLRLINPRPRSPRRPMHLRRFSSRRAPSRWMELLPRFRPIYPRSKLQAQLPAPKADPASDVTPALTLESVPPTPVHPAGKYNYDGSIHDSLGFVSVHPLPDVGEELPPFLKRVAYLRKHGDNVLAISYLRQCAGNGEILPQWRARAILQLADCLAEEHSGGRGALLAQDLDAALSATAGDRRGRLSHRRDVHEDGAARPGARCVLSRARAHDQRGPGADGGRFETLYGIDRRHAVGVSRRTNTRAAPGRARRSFLRGIARSVPPRRRSRWRKRRSSRPIAIIN